MLHRFKRMLANKYEQLTEPLIRQALSKELHSELYNIAHEQQRKALRETVEFVETELRDTPLFADRFKLLEHAVSCSKEGGLYCEFGVATGQTINFIATQTRATVYGFDSFQGLPEDWGQYMSKGSFQQSALPEVRENVELVVGLFADTLPRFLQQQLEGASFLHIDCDLYSSTKTVLDAFRDRIGNGTVLVFDEYYNYPGWTRGEHLAFCEFISAHKRGWEYLGRTNSQQLAVRIL